MAHALQLVPAGARQIAPGVFQQRAPRRGHGGGKGHGKKGHHKRHVSEFRKPYVMNAIAANVGVGLMQAWGMNVPDYIDPRALALFIYGMWRNNRSAIAAAKTMQATYIGTRKGVPNMVAGFARSVSGGGSFHNAPGGGGGDAGIFGAIGSTISGLTAPITSALGPAAGSAIGAAVSTAIAAAI